MNIRYVTRLTHSLTHTLIHSLTQSLIHSLSHSLTHTYTHTLTHSFTHSFTHPPTHSLYQATSSHTLTYQLTHPPLTHPPTHTTHHPHRRSVTSGVPNTAGATAILPRYTTPAILSINRNNTPCTHFYMFLPFYSYSFTLMTMYCCCVRLVLSCYGYVAILLVLPCYLAMLLSW